VTGDGRTLLLVAHGSRRPGAMAGLERFRTRLEAAFPDWRVAVARTMGRQHGPAAAYGGVGRVAEVLEGLLAAGARRIVVQSLHVVPGEEYQEMLAGLARQAAAAGERSVLTVGAPLLAGPGDVERVARALLARLPERRPDEGLVVMGHGAPPPAADFYAALGERLAAVDRLALFGTMPLRRGDPCPDIDRIRRTLVAAGTRTAWLVPFFTVAGATPASIWPETATLRGAAGSRRRASPAGPCSPASSTTRPARPSGATTSRGLRKKMPPAAREGRRPSLDLPYRGHDAPGPLDARAPRRQAKTLAAWAPAEGYTGTGGLGGMIPPAGPGQRPGRRRLTPAGFPSSPAPGRRRLF